MAFETSADCRELQGMQMRTLLLPLQWKMVGKGLEAGQTFQETVKNKTSGESLGSPYVMIALESLTGFTVQDGVPANQSKLRTWWGKEVADKSAEEVQAEIMIWSMRKRKKVTRQVMKKTGANQMQESLEEYARLQMYLGDKDVEGALAQTTVGDGSSTKTGYTKGANGASGNKEVKQRDRKGKRQGRIRRGCTQLRMGFSAFGQVGGGSASSSEVVRQEGGCHECHDAEQIDGLSFGPVQDLPDRRAGRSMPYMRASAVTAEMMRSGSLAFEQVAAADRMSEIGGKSWPISNIEGGGDTMYIAGGSKPKRQLTTDTHEKMLQ
eukprot:TRINITY_DN40444_c0_g1_i1.p1 TRINITY_DN40444_c0_g1~~TRINITY_DN40444_c0_g1_i1.p1  ORF type:complete len:369 (-),score=70.31 TRINITY_DN40444_c0_g1_i1:166-1134(-)